MKASVVRCSEKITRMTKWSDDWTCANAIRRRSSDHAFHRTSKKGYIARFLMLSSINSWMQENIPPKKMTKVKAKSKGQVWPKTVYGSFSKFVQIPQAIFRKNNRRVLICLMLYFNYQISEFPKQYLSTKNSMNI